MTMIIKSMSRKDPSFEQLVDYFGYFNKRESVHAVSHNLLCDGKDESEVVRAFLTNYECLAKRKNGNAMLHEIIALPPDCKLPRRKQIEMLKTLMQEWIKSRASRQLAYGVIHTDEPHLHGHILISANEIGMSRRRRLSKADFQQAKKELEDHQLEHFPELGTERLHDGSRKSAERVAVHEKTTSKSSHKQELAGTLKVIFAKTRSSDGLKAALALKGLTLYQRGQSVGVKTDGGRRYRLRTLGIEKEYSECSLRMELAMHNLQKIKERKQPTHSLEQQKPQLKKTGYSKYEATEKLIEDTLKPVQRGKNKDDRMLEWAKWEQTIIKGESKMEQSDPFKQGFEKGTQAAISGEKRNAKPPLFKSIFKNSMDISDYMKGYNRGYETGIRLKEVERHKSKGRNRGQDIEHER